MTQKPMRAELPDAFRLAEAISAAVDSAQDKHDDAELLLTNGRASGAYTIAALGIEELGKAGWCLSQLVHHPDGSEDREVVKTFWSAFTDHKAKDLLAYFLARVGGDVPLPLYEEELDQELFAAAAVTNDTKFRALYVDFNADGTVRRPTDVSAEDARAITGQLGRLLALARELLPVDEDPAEIVDFLRTVNAAIDKDKLLELFSSENRVPIIEQLRVYRREAEAAPPEWIRALFPTASFDGETADA